MHWLPKLKHRAEVAPESTKPHTPEHATAEAASSIAHSDLSNVMNYGYRLIQDGGLEPTFPIDVVYTWVDHNDPAFQERLAKHRPNEPSAANTGLSRFICHDELRYSLRSVEAFAPWVNHIYIVTDRQRPYWLADNPRITLVDHSEILDAEYLPTFNSHVIGSALHRVPGLSEHYIYFNDDIILLRPTEPADFFTASGIAYVFLGDTHLPDGPPLPNETASNWAAKNSAALLSRHGISPLRRRTAHVAHPQIKTVAEECEKLFAETYGSFRLNKFRAMNDLLVCSHLHPSMGYATRNMLWSRVPWWYLKIRKPDALNLYQAILGQRDTNIARMFACLNDTETRHPTTDYAEQLHAFLEAYLPTPSSFEDADATHEAPGELVDDFRNPRITASAR